MDMKQQKYYEQLKENTLDCQELANVGSWSYNILTGDVFLTEGIYRIFECKPQDNNSLGISKYDYLLSRIHEDDIKITKDGICATKQGTQSDFIFRVVSLNGTIKYIQSKSKALFDENQKPYKLIGYIQDITDNKISENELSELGNGLKSAQRLNDVGYFKYDVLKDEIYCSDEINRVLSINPNEFSSKFEDYLNIVHPDDRESVKIATDSCLSGKSYKVRHRIFQKDGSVKHFVLNGEPTLDEEGKVISVLGTIQDISEYKLLEEKLQLNLKRLSQAQKLAKLSSWEMDTSTNKIYWSDEVYAIFGMQKGDFDGTYEGFLKLIHPDDVRIIESIYNTKPTGNIEMEFRIIRADNSIRFVCQVVEFEFDKNSNSVSIFGTIQDITDKKKLEQEIAKIQKRFQVLVRESTDVFEILDPDGTIKYISDASTKVIGIRPEERIGKKVYDYYPIEQQKKIKRMIDHVLKKTDDIIHDDFVFIKRTGEQIYLEVSLQNLLHEPEIEGLVANFRDITKRVEMENLLTYLSTHDDLTKLPNRIYFKQQLEILIENNEPFGIMFIDIDDFKQINSSLGYQFGDDLICEIASRLIETLDSSSLICRYSSDRFGIILKNVTEICDCDQYAQKTVNIFKNAMKIEKYDLDVTVSIGIGIKGNDDNCDSLIKHTEIALYWAKTEGKNIYKFYNSDIDIQNYKRFQLRSDLRKALDNNEFKVYYQPMVSLHNNVILAAEALIRWEHPDWGLISPGEFIPVAEETGLIINIGSWLLKEVCKNYKQWQEKGYPMIKVSVNYSSIQFFEKNFVESIVETIQEYGLDTKFLIIEVTESVLMVNTEKIVSLFERLQSYGIYIALDDFGTGYSSLAYLNSFRINIIKINGEFTKVSSNETKGNIITKAIIGLTRDLNLKLVAEGIEHWDQLLFLKDLNCYTGQGYIFSRPLPVSEFEKILIKRKCIPSIHQEEIPTEERRAYYRKQFKNYIKAELTIKQFKGNKVNIGSTNVLVKNIGACGLCFVANIKLPISRDMTLGFTTTLINKEINVSGYPIWVHELDKNLYEYGVEFILSQKELNELVNIMNQVNLDETL